MTACPDQLRDFAPAHKLVSAEEMRSVVDRILRKRRTDAYKSQYDVMVCVRSVDAAEAAIATVPVEGSATEYGQAVDTALDALRENYYDSDGEYTSKGLVGDIGSDVYHVLQTQKSPECIDVDRGEARGCLLREMSTLARLTPKPLGGAIEATVKIDVVGESGVNYFVEMSFEKAEDGGVFMKGFLHADRSCRFPVVEEILELAPGGDR